jgi:hypothetical protein
MMAVYLREPDFIDGVPRAAGELVTVPDDYDSDNIASVVQRDVEQANQADTDARTKRIGERKQEKRFQEALAQLRTILQNQYPQFWNKLSNRPAVLDAIIDEMRADVSVLQRALGDPQWFVDTVTERLGKNGGR